MARFAAISISMEKNSSRRRKEAPSSRYKWPLCCAVSAKQNARCLSLGSNENVVAGLYW